jgi:hypothetical protein
VDYTNVEGAFLLMNLAVLAAKRLLSPSPDKRDYRSLGMSAAHGTIPTALNFRWKVISASNLRGRFAEEV